MWFRRDRLTWSAYCSLIQVLGVVHFDVSGNNSVSSRSLYMYLSLDILWIFVVSYHIQINRFLELLRVASLQDELCSLLVYSTAMLSIALMIP